MKIIKLSWSENRDNRFEHFYVIEGEKGPSVMSYPFGVSEQTAKEILNEQRQKKKLPPYNGAIVYVCLDMLSGRLYLPEMEDPFSNPTSR